MQGQVPGKECQCNANMSYFLQSDYVLFSRSPRTTGPRLYACAGPRFADFVIFSIGDKSVVCPGPKDRRRLRPAVMRSGPAAPGTARKARRAGFFQSLLRRSAKAARRKARYGSSAASGWRGAIRRRRVSRADWTLGGGEKDPGATAKAMRASNSFWSRMPSGA